MKSARGFTLIELLIAISIMAILTVMGMTVYTGVQKNARDARRKTDLNKINIYLETYYQNYGKYPPANNASATCEYATNCYVYSTQGDNWIAALPGRLPVDPINNLSGPWDTSNSHYSYAYGNVPSDGQTYDLTAQLENTSDNDRCGVKDWKFNPNAATSSVAAGHWCAGTNFGGTYSDQIYEASPDR